MKNLQILLLSFLVAGVFTFGLIKKLESKGITLKEKTFTKFWVDCWDEELQTISHTDLCIEKAILLELADYIIYNQ